MCFCKTHKVPQLSLFMPPSVLSFPSAGEICYSQQPCCFALELNDFQNSALKGCQCSHIRAHFALVRGNPLYIVTSCEAVTLKTRRVLASPFLSPYFVLQLPFPPQSFTDSVVFSTGMNRSCACR